MNTFHNNLRSEILQAQNRRADLVKQKLTFVSAAIGLGSIKFGELDTSLLLYVAPFVALAFDLYITGEDFGIKRGGAFLGREKSPAEPEEKLWENFVCLNRDGFSVIAGPLPSILVVVGALTLLVTKHGLAAQHGAWFALCFVLFVGLAIFGQVRNKRLRAPANEIDNHKQVSKPA
jgi:hypothetical protein